MILIDKLVTGLVAGYDLASNAESEILKAWRGKLLAAYSQQRENYENSRVESKKRMSEFLLRARLGFWLSSLLIILGGLSLPALLLIEELGNLQGPLVCFGPILFIGGVNGWAILGLLWYWRRDRRPAQPPVHPFKTNLIPSLLPAWKEGLRGTLPGDKPYEGATGEYHFIARLQALDPDTYILYRLRQQPGDDVDVVLVGSKGIWVFEVKYLKGSIRWRDGKWTHLKTYYGPNGVLVNEAKPVDEPFDQQWKRMSVAVAETLRRRAPSLARRLPRVLRLRGGLVFTHPKTTYDIPPGCPFNWGVIPFWLQTLANAPVIEGLDEHAIFEILEALLERHREISGETPTRSMLSLAKELRGQAEAHLEAWVDANA
jgi:hypothetical protein